MRKHLAIGLVLFLFSALGDLSLRLLDPAFRARLQHFSDSIGESLQALRPFALATDFYDRIFSSEYGYRPLSWAAPFNVTAARERLADEHPECAALVHGDLLAPQLWNQQPDLAQDLLNRPSPLGTVDPEALLRSLTTPTPLPFSQPVDDLMFHNLPTPALGLGQPMTMSQRLAALMATPTPLRFGVTGLDLQAALATPTPAPLTALQNWPVSGLSHGRTTTLALQSATCGPDVYAQLQDINSSVLGRHGLITLILAIPDAVEYTVRQSLAGGWASAVTAILALLVGTAALLGAGVVHPLAFVLLLPLAASLSAWLLLLPILLANLLFGWAIAAAELLGLVAAAVPPVLWLFQVGFRMAEAAAVDKAVDQVKPSTGQSAARTKPPAGEPGTQAKPPADS